MKIILKIVLLNMFFVHHSVCTQEQILIWDYDGTIVEQQTHKYVTEKLILPNVESLMRDKKNLNIVCSGIRTLRSLTPPLPPKKKFPPHKLIETFKNLMNKLPIKAVVFSPDMYGTECWILIKTDTGFEIRKAHKDARYSKFKGYFKKPDTGMLYVIKDLLKEWNITTDSLLFIGDTVQDRQAALTFGIPFKFAANIHTKKECSTVQKI